ncbi:MAG: hypothetical protein KJO61_02130, partial [Deltaproteobacteria bacterium]|nr:hypothetical protein [Deltaproteobacteria bacterium]
MAALSLYSQCTKEYDKITGSGSVGLNYTPVGNFKPTKDFTPPLYVNRSIDKDLLEEEMEREAKEDDKTREPGPFRLNYISAANFETTKDSAPPIYAKPSIDKDVLEEKLKRAAKENDKTPGPGSVESNYSPDDNSQTTKESAPQIYIDRLIDEDIDEEILQEEKFEDSRLGPGSIGITYRYYRNDTDNTETMTEHGAQVRWRQETISSGSFELLAQGLIADTHQDDRIKDGRVLFRQQE